MILNRWGLVASDAGLSSASAIQYASARLAEEGRQYGMLRAMVRRRGRTDPLNSVNAPRWLAVRDKLGRILQVQALEPGADLRGALKARTDTLAADGWDIDSVPTCCAFVFCQRENVRVCVSVEAVEPGTGVFDHFADEDGKQT